MRFQRKYRVLHKLEGCLSPPSIRRKCKDVVSMQEISMSFSYMKQEAVQENFRVSHR